MTTDGIKSLGGESDLIDGALTSSRSKEDGYRPEDDETRENVVEDEDEAAAACCCSSSSLLTAPGTE